MQHLAKPPTWQTVLDFWFPEGDALSVTAKAHAKYWFWRMRGGAHEAIIKQFSALTTQAAQGQHQAWDNDASSRLALIIVLDQFSRSVWQDSARAFAQDQAALALSLNGLSNGHYQALTLPWQKVVFTLPLGHCEGPDHLERIDYLIDLRRDIAAQAPPHLQAIYQQLLKQAGDVREIIARFGRHPHRNAVLGRPSTPEEERYIQQGRFPHQRAFEDNGS